MGFDKIIERVKLKAFRIEILKRTVGAGGGGVQYNDTGKRMLRLLWMRIWRKISKKIHTCSRT